MPLKPLLFDEVERLIARLKVVHGIDQMQIDLVVLAMPEVGDGVGVGDQAVSHALEDELVGAGIAEQLIDAEAAGDLVVAGTAANCVVATGAIDVVVAAAAKDCVFLPGCLVLSSDGLRGTDDVVALRALDVHAVDIGDVDDGSDRR